MSAWRTKRQISILVLIFIVIGAIVAGLYFRYKPALSCTDGILNQGERGIDCGGPCARVCADEISPLVVEWVRPFRVVDGHYDVIAKVRNPNNQIGVPVLSYTIEIFDAQNISISKRSGTTFANANETSYLFEGNLFTGLRVPKFATLTLNGPTAWARSNASSLAITILNKIFTDGAQPVVTASVVNESLLSFRNVSLVAVLYDAEGNAYGGSATLIESLPKDARQDISFVWREPFSNTPASIDIIPRVNTFNHADAGTL